MKYLRICKYGQYFGCQKWDICSNLTVIIFMDFWTITFRQVWKCLNWQYLTNNFTLIHFPVGWVVHILADHLHPNANHWTLCFVLLSTHLRQHYNLLWKCTVQLMVLFFTILYIFIANTHQYSYQSKIVPLCNTNSNLRNNCKPTKIWMKKNNINFANNFGIVHFWLM